MTVVELCERLKQTLSYSPMNQREKALAYGAWIAVCIIWGTTYLAIRVAVRTLPDVWLSGVRFAIAGTVMSLILKLRGEKFPPLSHWKYIGLSGVLLIGIGNWFVVIAERTVPSGPTSLLIATLPFWIMFAEALMAKKLGAAPPRIGPRQIGGFIIGFCGVLLLVLPQLKETFDSRYLFGVVLLQVANVAWGAGSIYSKYKKVDAGPLVNAALQMLIGGAFMCVVGLIRGEFHPIQWETDGIVAFLYLLLVGSMVAYVCFIYALSKLPASLVSLYGYINPMIAIWLGRLILNEEVGWNTIAATVVILGGTWLVKQDH